MKWNISSDRYEFLEEAAFSTGSYFRVYIVCHVASALRLYMTLQSFVNSDIRRRGLDGPQLNLPSQRVTCALIKGIPHLISDNHVNTSIHNTSITAWYKWRTSRAASSNTHGPCLNVHRVLNLEESSDTQAEDL